MKSALSLLIVSSFLLAPFTGLSSVVARAAEDGGKAAISDISGGTAVTDLKQLDKGKWAPDTLTAIKSLIKKNAKKKASYVVFDWDNTCIYPDTEENLFIYQIENLAYKMTPEEFAYAFTHYTDVGVDGNLPIPTDNFDTTYYANTAGEPVNITKIAADCVSDYTYFYNNYRVMNPASAGNMTLAELQATPEFQDFKAKMWFTYGALYEAPFTINIDYTWIMYVMFPGFTSAEIKDLVVKATDWGLARESKKVYFDSPASLPGQAGAVSNTAAGNYWRNCMRLTPEIGGLWETFEDNKIKTYISTASLQDIIEAVATNPKYGYNLPENRVLGMRLKTDSEGRFLCEYDTSGGYTINSIGGKTDNIISILVSKYKANPILIAGDSDGDYPMMSELSGLNNVTMEDNKKPLQMILIINRLKKGNIGELCKIAAAQLDGTVPATTTKVMLQGRDENTGQWIPTEKTLKLGKVYSEENLKLLP